MTEELNGSAPFDTDTERRTGAAARTPVLEPGEPSDLDLMLSIQQEDPEALSKLYDRYNGILKALILRVIHNESEADDLLQEILKRRMQEFNQAHDNLRQKTRRKS